MATADPYATIHRPLALERSVFVVVPCYNEGDVLLATLNALRKTGATVVAVDDGSSDATWARLEEAGVHALRHSVNLGQGAALQTGTEYSLERGARFIVHFDADGQHPVDQIADLLAPLRRGEADLVVGSRFLRAQDRRLIPRGRRWALRVAVWINTLLTHVRLTDAHNGMRALTADAAGRIRLLENRQAHASEILIRARELGLRLREVPVGITYSAYSQTKGQSVLEGIDVIIDLVLRRLRL